ncbi:MAG TPA: group II intron reverse transcriptase/maturase [Anaeromyxobacteraceae bacterium]|nr:group II intron reverse transcriptase/maturase [Anaeromyxobacteraceae bacterium]
MVLTTLAHHIDLELLREAHRLTRKDGAVGVDDQTAEEYAANLEGNLVSLHERLKAGTYVAPPVRRVHIPKGDGSKTRPIGIPTFEDKVLQKAVAMVLEAVYEQDFLDCSFGFRPQRSAHQALQLVWERVMAWGGVVVLEVDIQAFFDSLDHGHLRSFLDQRVRDGVIRRVIDKWLKAGVLEEGGVSHPEAGTPQGGVISPLLANVYLHEVVDKWFASQVRPRLRGQAHLVRYADDFVILFAREDDARRVLDVLPKRLAKYGLTLHPTKTRLVPFRPPGPGGGEPGTFDFLGFTHVWARSRKGRWVVKRKTARGRFNRALKRITAWCKQHRHDAVREQHRYLCRAVRGHNGYYGIAGNSRALARFGYGVMLVWLKWLQRRSQRAMTVERKRALLQHFPLPPPRITQRYYWLAANP